MSSNAAVFSTRDRRTREFRGAPAAVAARRRRDDVKTPSQTQIEFANELVVVELFGGAAFEGDLAVDDDITAVGDADGLVEVLLGHQHRQLVEVLQFLDLLDRALDEDRRDPDRWLVD